jgi:peptide/nickel transport system permease protein
MAFFRKLVRRKTSLFAFIFLCLISFAAVFGPLLTPGEIAAQNLASRLKPPGSVDTNGTVHFLGTDQLGRDILARLVAGSRLSLTVGIAAVLGGGLLGLALGVVAGYFGGKTDAIIMRLSDIQLAFPFLLLALALVSILGPSLANVIIVLSITSWINYARVVRGDVLSVRNREYVEASRSSGATALRIMVRHVIPNIMSPFLVVASFQVAALIIAESSLSFLGLGVPVGTPTWGGMLSDGREYMTDAWWVAFFPGVAIMLTALSFNLIGDGIRDALDPSLNQSSRTSSRRFGLFGQRKGVRLQDARQNVSRAQ